MEECELRNVCRACLVEEGDFQSVFVPEVSSGLTIHLSEMMSACASIQVTLGDGLPEQICSACVASTVNMYLFKLKCEKSDSILRERLRKVAVCYEDQFLQKDSNDNEDIIKPEINGDSDNRVTQNEPVLEDFDDFSFDNYKSDSEDFPNHLEEDEVANQGVALKQQNKVKEFECEICQKRFSREDLLIRHKIAHAMKMDEERIDLDRTYNIEDSTLMIKSEEFMFSCSECDVLFIEKEDLDNHISQEHEKKEVNMSCDVCMKKFQKLSHLNRHARIHSAEKTYKCPSCDKGFSRQEQLTHHMNVHQGIKPHTCDICFKGFNQISNLKDHMRTHNGEKPFLCSTCGKGFNQLGNLRQHTIRHSGVKAHLCSTCGNGFASKGELSAHLRKHTGARPFVCPVCNHGFTTSSSLTKHKRIHSGEKPYECDVCKMKFSRSGILARHKRTHTGEKPYVCKFCAKAFSQSNDLTSHLRIHTGEKPFICDECGQAFRQSSALKTHKKTHIEKSIILDSKPILLSTVLHSNVPFSERFMSTF